MYLIGGNGKNNRNLMDSNPVHEILTYLQMRHMGYDDLAKGMAFHFVSRYILEIEKKQGRFNDVDAPAISLNLAILTAADAFCTDRWLPAVHGSYEAALKARVEDVIIRRKQISSEHPLVSGYENGGKEYLEWSVGIIEGLREGNFAKENIGYLAF
jgi:hypothetical protein